MIARTSTQYKRLLQALLPKGKLWSIRDDSLLSKVLHAIGDEMSRIETRILKLIEERDSRTAEELLEEHELDYGLPEIGESIAETTDGRQAEIHSAVLRVGQQFEEYFVDIAAALGYTIEVEEYPPFIAGYNTAGDPCGPLKNLFYYKILIDIDSVEYSKEFNLTKLISRMKSIKPAHSHILFGYKNAEFGRGFGLAFDAIRHYDNSWYEWSFDASFSNAFANAVDYDGVNFIGAFNSAFSIDFDSYPGGEFNNGFSTAFRRIP